MDWESINEALSPVPWLFRILACKQVTGIAGTCKFSSRYDEGVGPSLSCTVEKETCGHILHCQEQRRVQSPLASLHVLEELLEEDDMDLILVEGIMAFVWSRGEGQ